MAGETTQATTQSVATASSTTAAAAAPVTPATTTAATVLTQPESTTGVVKAAEITYTLKLPEGALLDAGHVEKTVSFAKERGLSNEQAQAVLERDAAARDEMVKAQRTELEKKTAKDGEWHKAFLADPEIGGAKAKESAEDAKRVIEKYGSKALRDIFDSTGVGNHVELVRVFAKIGRAMRDDKLVQAAATTSGQPKSIAERLFPGTPGTDQE